MADLRFFLPLLLTAMVSCVSHEAAKPVTEPVAALTSSKERIVEVRSGNVFCQGYLLEKRKVLLEYFCYQPGQRIVLRRLDAPALETVGDMIGQKLTEYVIIEADADLADHVVSRSASATGTDENVALYFYDSAKRQWFTAELHAEQKSGPSLVKLPATITPLFKKDGSFNSFTSRMGIMPDPVKGDADFEKDRDYSPFSPWNIVDRLTAGIIARPMAAAIAKSTDKPNFSLNMDFGVGFSFYAVSAEAAVVLRPNNAAFTRIAYDHALFKHFDDQVLAIKPFVGNYRSGRHHAGTWTGLDITITRKFNVEVSAIHYADGPSLMVRLGVLPLFF